MNTHNKHRSLFIFSFLAIAALFAATALIPVAQAYGYLHYQFKFPGIVYETRRMSESSSPYFWINSGGKFILSQGSGKTVHGALDTADPWRLLYAAHNPLDTDNGYFPQNIFRLVTKSTWNNAVQQVSFKINATNLTDSPNRAGHNGVLLMSRYQDDGQTLYYAGIRVDGAAVIKRKYNGAYTTLAYNKVFEGAYNRRTNPTLLPQDQWMGIKSTVENLASGRVRVRLYLDRTNSGNWVKVAETYDTDPIRSPGYAGVRSDFMDLEFDEYILDEM